MSQLHKYMARTILPKCADPVMRRKNVHSCALSPAKYGNTLIPDTDISKHLGIMQSSDGKLSNDVDALKNTIRGTFLSITGKVSDQAGPNPSTALKLYYACMLPKTIRLRAVE